MNIKLEITECGDIAMLHNKDVDIKDFQAKVKICRASHVEFSNKKQKWYVQSAATLKMLKDDFNTREEALEWEKEYYSPDGAGWEELDYSFSKRLIEKLKTIMGVV